MAKLPPELFDELAALVELDDGRYGLFDETADIEDGRVILGSTEQDHAYGGFYPGRLRELAGRGLIEYGEVIRLTDRGRDVVRAAGGPSAKTAARTDVTAALEHVDLHPAIDQRVRRAFEHDDAQQAVAEAFGALEVQIRAALNSRGVAPRGVGLSDVAAHSFRPGGPLADPETDPGQQEGLMQLFRGAAGAVRNPNAHGRPVYDPAEALRLVLFADHLLRVIDTAPRQAS